MNVPLIHIIRKRLPLIAPTVLVALGVALIASALMAQSRPKTTANHIPNCFVDNWPPHDATEKKDLVDAFNNALKDSAVSGAVDDPGPTLRKKLLDTRNNFEAPKKAMKDKLKEVNPNSKIKFPNDLVIIFYEPELGTSPTPPPSATEQANALRCALLHPNHCYIVVFLEPVNSPVTNPSLKENMMCCYDPY
jgi:hypothetical protein